MRTDDIGLFWQDTPVSRKRSERALGPMPPIPKTGWTTPREFPNLSDAPVIGLDVETYDPHLLTHGPGWSRRLHSQEKRGEGVPPYLHPVGSLVGVSVAAYGKGWYFPMRHTIHSETNLDPDRVLEWLRVTLAGNQPKIGTNLMYDVGWLQEEGVVVNGPLLDISFAEGLLTEGRSLSLDGMASRYLGTGKETSLLYQWCADWYGGEVNGSQRKNIWRAPPSLVGPYAEADAVLPLRIFAQQEKLLGEQGLINLFDMECRLIRLLLAMRFRGVRVDIERAEQVDTILTNKINKAQAELNTIAEAEVDVNKATTLALAFDNLGIKYPLTPKTEQPSFTQPFLKSVDHPIAGLIRDVRKYHKLRDTFVRSYILDAHVNGRLHCQFHPMRTEKNGTRSGRFSSSNPNLQNIPSRDPELAPLIRSIFIPEEGGQWRRYDYSQIEYRFLLHYAVGEGADAARQQYWDDPRTDYHAIVQERLKVLAKRELARKATKNINFGLVYGMGEPKLAQTLQLPIQEARLVFADYHDAVPYVRTTMQAVVQEAQNHGYITTVLGRRSRFDMWEPKAYGEGKPLPFDLAVRTYGGAIKRSSTHKALNRRLQGSAADLLKAAMLHCHEEGLFNDHTLPHLTVHDELDFTAMNPHSPVWTKIQNVMENVMQLRVPIKAEMETGPNWGNLQKDE